MAALPVSGGPVSGGPSGGLPVVLAVGGTDSGGGAGLAADVAVLRALGTHPAVAVTTVTAQDSRGVHGAWPVPDDALAAQLRVVLADLEPRVVKVGALPTVSSVGVVVAALRAATTTPLLVVDPVGVSSTGGRLAEPGVPGAVAELLLPLSTVVTPNLGEAGALLGTAPPTDLAGAAVAARALVARGTRWALVTGGHLPGEPVDLLAGGEEVHRLAGGPRVVTPHTHGTGCVLASALAARLAHGDTVPVAARAAQAHVRAALSASYPAGSGAGPVHPRGGL